MIKLYSLAATVLLANLFSVSFAATDDNITVRTRDNQNRTLKMCQQAKNVLGQIRVVDASVSLDINCEVEEDFVKKSLFGLTNTIEYYNVTAQFTGDISRSCSDSSRYKVIRTDLMSTHYSSDTGMPAGINPFLKGTLDKLGVDYEYTLKSTQYKTKAPLEVLILYPSC